ncbi:MAG: efflux RND transporter periplasmic adaptor subunit [Verrucomicrobiae bacterium]|nr:efflux RND transporter periplasmic adaptor subunit [Verrucomicrobiae bacterium]
MRSPTGSRPPDFSAILACLVAMASAMVSCRKSNEESPSPATQPAAKIKTTEVGRQKFTDQVEALGTVRAEEAIELSANVTERVAEVAFEDGARVKKGDLLVRLEDAEEVAMMEGAKAEMAEQEREIQRLQGLVSEGAVSEVRLEEYRTRREVAKQRVAEARAQIDDRHIEAPFDGVLGFRRVSVGALVSPGDLIATLDILDPVKLDFTVPETFLDDLEPGQEIVALTEAYPGDEFSGKVTQIDTRVNVVTRSITVRAEMPNPDTRLRPGMLMTTTLKKNPKESLSVPERAVVSVQSNHFVYVVSQESGKPIAKRTSITLGRRIPGFVEVLEGLEKDQIIVTDGLVGLSDGAPIEVIGKFEAPAEPYQPASL